MEVPNELLRQILLEYKFYSPVVASRFGLELFPAVRKSATQISR